MAVPNIKNLTVDQLITLRGQIDSQLVVMRTDLQKQIARLERAGKLSEGTARRGRPPKIHKGGTLPPKYRDPESGATWAGRGAQPRWLVAALKAGKKAEDFLVAKAKAAARSAKGK